MGILGEIGHVMEGDEHHEEFRHGFHRAKEKYEEVIRRAIHHLEEGEDHEAKHILHEALEE